MLNSLIEYANAAGARWAAWIFADCIDSAVLLVFVGLLWLAVRKRVAPQIGYWLFLLVPLKLLIPFELTVPAVLAAWTPSTIVFPSLLRTDRISEDHGPSRDTGRLAFAEGGSREGSGASAPISPDSPTSAVPPRADLTARSSMQSDGPSAAARGSDVLAAAGTTRVAGPLPSATDGRRVKIAPVTIALGLWLAVVLVLAVRFTVRQLSFWLRLRTAAGLDRSRLAVDPADLCRRAGVTQQVEFVESTLIAVPAVFGILRSTIVLPPRIASSLTASQLEWVLLHELAHVRRRDLLIILLQRSAAILHFFNPAVWVANQAAHRLREYACDDFAMSLSRGSRIDFGEAFVQILRNAFRAQRRLEGALGIFGLDEQATSVQRVRRMLDAERPIGTRPGRLSLCAVVLIAAVALPRLRAADGEHSTPSPSATSDAKSTGKADLKNADAQPPGSKAAAAPAQPPATFDLRIVGPDGKPVPNAKMELRNKPDLRTEQIRQGKFLSRARYGTKVQSDGDGRLIFELPHGLQRLDIILRTPGYASYWAQWDPQVNSEPVPANFTARLEAGWTVGGIVVDGEGQPVKGVQVHPNIEFTKRPGDSRQLGIGDQVQSDGEGKWTFDRVPVSMDEVAVEIIAPNFMSERRTLTRAKFGVEQSKSPSAKIVLNRGLTVTGKVTDESGKPIAGAVVSTRFGNDRRRAVTGPDGIYRLAGCQPVAARIVAWAKGHATDMQEIRIEADPKPVDFQMKPGGTIRIRVLDERGNPIPKARIFFQSWRGPIQYFEFDQVNQYADEQGVWEWKEAPLEMLAADICRPGGMQLGRRPLMARKEEYVFRVPPPLVVSGKVVDAETKQPIKNFRVVPGRRWTDSQMSWDDRDSFTASDGHYQVREESEERAFLVRIEAEGYQPAVSRDIKVTEGNVTVDFELTKGHDIFATVLTAANLPAMQAKVALGIAGSQIMVKNGDIDDRQTYCARRETDTAGQFRFPPESGGFCLVITHPAGYAQLKCSPESSPKVIHLTPWARVDGTFRVAGKPQADVPIWIGQGLNSEYGPKAPHLFTDYQETTDAQGRFVFDRVIPGQGQIGRSLRLTVKDGSAAMTSSCMVPVKFVAGQTTHLEFGTSGRPVVGKLRRTAGPKPEVPWSFARVEVRPEDPARRESSLHFTATPDREGNFCIDDVPVGDYGLLVRFDRPGGGYLVGHHFSVPAINDKLSQKPVDIGVLTLTPGDLQPFNKP